MFLPYSDIRSADSTGRIRGLGAGRSLVIAPAGLSPGSSVGLTALVGKLQEQVPLVANGAELELPEDFQALEVTGATPNATYLVVALPKGSHYKSTGAKSNQVENVVPPPTAMPTAAPSGNPATQVQVYPSWQQWNLGVRSSVAAQNVNLWAKTISGDWQYVEQLLAAGDWDQTSITAIVSRAVAFGGGFIYFQAGGNNVTYELDVAYQVGG